jgi:uncharacterized protein YjbI with pentapeptide repeats
MGNVNHQSLLKQGVHVWNDWRVNNPDEIPDLSFTDLSSRKITGANFAKTNFRNAVLNGWGTVDCNFEEALLTGVSAQGSYWRNATLRFAEISGDFITSNIYIADLTGANVHHCGFPLAELRFLRLYATKFAPYLSSTDLNSWTIIGSDLSQMRNLASAVVEYPFNIDFDTLRKTAEGLQKFPELTGEFSTFFKNCGLPNEIIAVFKSWVEATPTIDEATAESDSFYSCFISYSHKNRDFAKLIHEHLQKSGIQCWFDEEYLLPGDDILDAVDNGIRKWDKILLCCSRDSLNSPWVDRELDKALQKEEKLWRETGKKSLAVIPLNMDGYLFSWENSKASILQSRLAADFTNWDTNQEKFKVQIEKIIRALRADNKGRPRQPNPKL